MIVVNRDVIKQCPYREEVDYGKLSITFPDDAIELHHLGELIDDMTDKRLTHEDYTRRVLALLPLGCIVTTRWKTGPWVVECTESAILH